MPCLENKWSSFLSSRATGQQLEGNVGAACMKSATNKDLDGMNAKRTLLNALAKHIPKFSSASDLSKFLSFFVLHLFLIFECKIILFYVRIINKLDVNIKVFQIFSSTDGL
jgi:hypothetical protein